MQIQNREEIEEIFYKWKSIMKLTSSFGSFSVKKNHVLLLSKMLEKYFSDKDMSHLKSIEMCKNILQAWGEFLVKNQIKLYSAESMQGFSYMALHFLTKSTKTSL